MKKQDKEVLTIFVIIILVIVFMAVLLGVLAKPNEPHFKITKEECRNETWREFLCANGEGGNLTDNNFWKIRDTLENCSVLTSYPFCEQVEVDEIKIEREFDEYCSMFGWTHVSCEWDNETKKGMQRGNVLKSDLTIEWLEENCECLDLQGNPTKAYNSCRTHSTDNKYLEEEGSCCAESKYRCGEYFVETWGQIK